MPDPPVGIQALPEELLSEILSDQVLMPREIFEAQLESKGHWEFSTTESKWLYARRTYPLLVCKQWFRVGKALLYEAVVVGSTKFLLQIIDIISRSDVGNAVKRLRLEDGAYGEDLNRLVALTPRIHTVFVSLNIYRRSSVAGLVSALPTLNPLRVLVKDSEDMYSVTREARDVVARCIRQWTSLKRVDLVNPSPPRPWILEALRDSPSLLYVCAHFDVPMVLEGKHYLPLMESRTLKALLCVGSAEKVDALKKRYSDPVTELLEHDGDGLGVP